MGREFSKDVGQLDPAFTADRQTRIAITPPDGILKQLLFFIRGDHTTNITTAQIDGEANIFSAFQVRFPRKNLPPILWDVLPRDLKHLLATLSGTLPATLNPTATTGVHRGLFGIPLALGERHTRTPDNYGLDTRDLAGPIIVEAQYGGVASIGAGSTAITNITDVVAVMEERRRVQPKVVLSATQNRFPIESDARHGPLNINTANIEALYGLMLRQHDDSDAAAQRQNGLVTRFIIEHSQRGRLSDELFSILQSRMGTDFGIDAASLPDGIALPVFARGGRAGDMPLMVQGRKLDMIADTVETVPVDVTNIPPAAGDAVYAIPIGVQFTGVGLRGLEQAAPGLVRAGR